ncbi:MAG: hypothetical protein EB078_04360 [Proteobacteria bacterium]|nr:hypothetical protein [Pseudomonadota bacterium]NDC24177.1 hypothetical protein [Pseudomonadota bacterium]NDD04116.1 hypothetical protein [Pseudomonadota bacterium]
MRASGNRRIDGTRFSHHFLEKLSQEILEVVTSHIQADNSVPLNGIFLCGGGSQLTGMKETLYRTLQLPIQALNPLKHVVGTGERMGLGLIRDAHIYATVGVGLALRQPRDKKKKARRAVLK